MCILKLKSGVPAPRASSLKAGFQQDFEACDRLFASQVAAGIRLDSDGNDRLQAFVALLNKADSVDLSNGHHFTSWYTDIASGICEHPIVVFSWGSEDDEVAHEVTISQKAVAEGAWDGDYFVCIDVEGAEIRLKLNRHVAITPEAINTN